MCPYANVGLNGTAIVGDIRNLDQRWTEAVALATQTISPNSPDRGHINLMKSEGNLRLIKAAIEKAKRFKWAAARRDPHYYALIDELIKLRSRYHASWMEIERLRRAAALSRSSSVLHKILGDIDDAMMVQPDKINDAEDFEVTYPTSQWASLAVKEYTTRCIAIEAQANRLRDVVSFDTAPASYQDRECGGCGIANRYREFCGLRRGL
jgi:hypothetical protein